MLTIKDIIHIPYPEEQKELKPGYTVLDLKNNKTIVLKNSNFDHDDDPYILVIDDENFTRSGKINSSDFVPVLIVIDVPKVPKKIRLAPALYKSSPNKTSVTGMLFESLEQAKNYFAKNQKIIWPAPQIGPDGFYEFSDEDWK